MTEQNLSINTNPKRVKYGRSISNQRLVTIISRDDTMQGLFGNGDPVQVDVNVDEFVGDAVYVFTVNGDQYIRRLQSRPGEGYLAIPDNKDFRSFLITPDMDLSIQGIVTKAWQGKNL